MKLGSPWYFTFVIGAISAFLALVFGLAWHFAMGEGNAITVLLAASLLSLHGLVFKIGRKVLGPMSETPAKEK